MSFGEYYSKKGHQLQTMDSIIQDAQNKVLGAYNQKVTKAECEKLEKFFNDLFYPKDDTPIARANSNKIKNLISQSYQQKYAAAIDNFDIGSRVTTYGTQISDLPQLIREKFESFEHKEKIYINTLESRLANVKEALTKVTGAPELEAMESELATLEGLLVQLLDYKSSGFAGSDARGSFLFLKKDGSPIAIVAQMDALYQSLSQIGGAFTPSDYGQVLEWTLQAFSAQADNLSNEYADELIQKELIDKITKTAGSTTTGSGIKVAIDAITTDEKFVKKKQESGSTSFEIGSGKGKFSFKAIQGFNPNSDRQGKMDVNFEFNDEGNIIPFRISAKNWMNLHRDLGTTNVAYALIRSLEMDSALAYAYTLQDERKEYRDQREIAHKVAKYAILVDILMGYSQIENYADTLFLNIREEKRVAVYSISEIIQNINNNLDLFEVDGYSSVDIYGHLVKIRKALGKSNRSQDFESLSLKYLQATQVRLQYSNIAKFI